MQLIVDRVTDQIAVRLRDNSDAETLMVVFPAMGTPAGYYDRLALSLVEGGFAVAVADLRGTGASQPKPSRASAYGYHELVDDVGAVLAALKDQRAGRRTVLLGHSLGGQACVMYAARQQGEIDAIVLIAVGMPYWRVYGRQRLGVFGVTQGISAISRLLRVWPGWGFGGRQARNVMLDWGYTGRHGVFPPHLHVEENLSAITVPVLAISVDDDQFTPSPATDHLVNKLTSAPLQREHLTTQEAGIPLDHFKWVKAGAAMTGRITAWLANSGTPEGRQNAHRPPRTPA